MKILFILISLILSSSIYAQEKTDNSITVHNLSSDSKHVWVNAVSYNILHNTSLRVPCNSGENIEVQYIYESTILPCGSTKELNNEQ